ncbi:MAG: site-2 protease family protein [Anaerolineae bacterium]|nr:site-2 protease family protein [Anaerolineae bacterium]
MTGFLLTVVELVIILGVMIFVHELGHYLAALWMKIPVEEFGIGYPPKVKTLFTWRGTEFTLNAIPFGGFVRPRGEDDPGVEGGIEQAPAWRRLIVLVSGALMNLLMGVLIFSLLFVQTGGAEIAGILVTQVDENSPAAAAGLLAEDVILSVNGEEMLDLDRIVAVIDANGGEALELTVARGEETLYLTAIPAAAGPNDANLGVGITYAVRPVDLNYFQALGYGVRTVGDMIELTFKLPAMLIRGEISAEEARVSGPVGIGQMLGQAREVDVAEQQSGTAAAFAANTLWLVGAIAVGLGFANLLPLPALDGGRILFVLVEMIFRKRLPGNVEATVHAVGFILLIAVSVLITVNDIFNPINLPLP